MKGITIIEEHFCRDVEMPALIIIGLIVTLACIGALAFYRCMYKNRNQSASIAIMTVGCSFVVVLMLVVFWIVTICNYNKTHFEYTIEVDNSVGFNDFFDRYEIISADGDKYRVKEIDSHIKE